MELVTITCKEDLELCVYQLKSIHKFVEPCTVNVVINETDVKFARMLLKRQTRVMYKHKIKFWSRTAIIKTDKTFKNGWISQQLLKLLIPLPDDYIVLDCKDIFLKPTKITDIAKLHYKNQPDPSTCKSWGNFYNEANNVLYKTYPIKINPKEINGIQTPRLMKKSVLEEIGKVWKSKKKFINWWAKLNCSPSEFILYDYIAYSTNQMLPKTQRFLRNEIVGIWNMDMYNTNQEVNLNDIKDETRILKIHKRVFNNQEVNKAIRKWLDKRLK